jgi:hypothetical protein
MGAEAIKTVTKKQRKFRKELQIRLIKREEEENKKRLRNKLRNERKKTESRKKRGFHPTRPHLREWKHGTRTISQSGSETCVTG